MAKITVEEVRQILKSVFEYNDELQAEMNKKKDEDFLQTNLEEFGLDSLDFEDMLVELQNLYGINVARNSFARFYREPTVENFINMVNDYGID